VTAPDPDDADIVARVLAGDQAAFAILVARYRPRLGRYAVRMLGSAEDAEEALQDTFVRGYRSLGRCAEPERVGAWLFTILVNRCRTIGARSSRRARTFVPFGRDGDGDPTEGVATRGQSMDERLAWREEIDRALAALDVAQREAFLLKYVEELSYEEIAESTGVGISALKMRVKRACDRLRELLQQAYSG
jgi:RNA polymerase sigma-70 factor (ECF subfamily)